MVGEWVTKHDPAMAWPPARRTVFDLRGANSLNFLDDQCEYDAVVLFAIFNPPIHSVAFQRAVGGQRGQTSLAANHSRDRRGSKQGMRRAGRLRR